MNFSNHNEIINPGNRIFLRTTSPLPGRSPASWGLGPPPEENGSSKEPESVSCLTSKICVLWLLLFRAWRCGIARARRRHGNARLWQGKTVIWYAHAKNQVLLHLSYDIFTCHMHPHVLLSTSFKFWAKCHCCWRAISQLAKTHPPKIHSQFGKDPLWSGQDYWMMGKFTGKPYIWW